MAETEKKKKPTLYEQGFKEGQLRRMIEQAENEYKQGKEDGYNSHPQSPKEAKI